MSKKTKDLVQEITPEVPVTQDKFVLVQENEIIYDETMKSKSIGYYQDAWIRFRKNKASVVAAIILLILIFMSIIGPYLFKYDLPYDERENGNAKWSNRLNDLPPKVKGLENFNFWNGSKVIDGFPLLFEEIENQSDAPVIIEIVNDEPNAVGQITARIDYYEYQNYIYSVTQTTNLSPDEYAAAVAYDNEILNDDDPDNDSEVIILQDAALINGAHKVKVDFFLFLEVVYETGDVGFWFGTDNQGRDLFTLLWSGARLSLMIAFGVASINIINGLIVGSIAGYYGGLIDLIIERINEILGGLPFLAILTLLLLRYGNQVWVVILAFTLTSWIGIARLTRSQFYRYKYREYVLAARTLGAKDARIMARHIFPSAVGTLITSLVLYIPGVIFAESTYSFLGIINYGEQTSVGRLLSNGQLVMKDSFYMIVFPAIFISLLMLSFNLFGNGLRDAFNPSLRGVEE
jgi:oligopeptide transport system permease protein